MYNHKQVRAVKVLNSLNSTYNNMTTVVFFLQMIKYAIIMNCNNPCTFEIKHITSSFDFDPLRKYSNTLHTCTSMHLVFSLYRSVIFKLENCIDFVFIFLNLCCTLHCDSQLLLFSKVCFR